MELVSKVVVVVVVFLLNLVYQAMPLKKSNVATLS